MCVCVCVCKRASILERREDKSVGTENFVTITHMEKVADSFVESRLQCLRTNKGSFKV